MSADRRFLIAVPLGLLFTMVSVLPVEWAAYALAPRIWISRLVGAGTLHDPGRLGIGATILIFYVGSVVVWVAVAYAVVSVVTKRRAA